MRGGRGSRRVIAETGCVPPVVRSSQPNGVSVHIDDGGVDRSKRARSR